MPTGNNKILFANTVKTDGFTVDFLFPWRQNNASIIKNDELELKCSETPATYFTQIPLPRILLEEEFNYGLNRGISCRLQGRCDMAQQQFL